MQPFLVAHEQWEKEDRLESGEQEEGDPCSLALVLGAGSTPNSILGTWSIRGRATLALAVGEAAGKLCKALQFLCIEGSPGSSWLGLAKHPH